MRTEADESRQKQTYLDIRADRGGQKQRDLRKISQKQTEANIKSV
jgi:hypothetical protein